MKRLFWFIAIVCVMATVAFSHPPAHSSDEEAEVAKVTVTTLTDSAEIYTVERPYVGWTLPMSVVYNDRWGVGAGLGYDFPRWRIAGQVLYFEPHGATPDVTRTGVCSRNWLSCYKPPTYTYTCPGSEETSRWGAVVTVTVPLRR
jgi:hypothetical protein